MCFDSRSRTLCITKPFFSMCRLAADVPLAIRVLFPRSGGAPVPREHREPGQIFAVGDEHLPRAVRRSRCGMQPASPPCRRSRRRCATSASMSRNVMSAIVEPSRSSTPAVAPAMMSRGDFEPAGEVRRQRVGVHVEQLAIARRPDARHHRHVTLPAQVDQQCRFLPADRLANAAEIDGVTRWSTYAGGAALTRPTPASAPVRPTAGTPAAPSAATNRVFTRPASTLTTISSVGSSVMRSPRPAASRCRHARATRRSRARRRAR